ncbi:class I SAM-dependent methyltransferase [Planctomycetota bacterium]
MHPKQKIFDNLFSWFKCHYPAIDSKWHIAEFGVGKYGFASIYATKFKKVYGIDIEDYSSYHKNVEFVLSINNRIPLQDRCVDMVVSHSVLEHVEDLDSSLSEINRILKPKGLLFLTVSPLYFSSFGAHLYRDGKRLEQWEHLIPGSSVYMTSEPLKNLKIKGSSLNGLTCNMFLQHIGRQPWNIIYFERDYERKCVPENVDRTVAPEIDLITKGMRFIGQKVPWPTSFF